MAYESFRGFVPAWGQVGELLKDFAMPLAILVLGVLVPHILPFPPIDPQGVYYALSSVFQGLSALLGLLAVFAVYRAQSLETQDQRREESLRNYLQGLGVIVSYRDVTQLPEVIRRPPPDIDQNSLQILRTKCPIIDQRVAGIEEIRTRRDAVLLEFRKPMYLFAFTLALSIVGLLVCAKKYASSGFLWGTTIAVVGMSLLGIWRAVRFCFVVLQKSPEI